MKKAGTLVILAAIVGVVAVAASSGLGLRHEVEGIVKVDDVVKLDRSRLLERASDAPNLKAGRATQACGPLSTLLADGGSPFLINFGTTTFFDGFQWNAGSDFPTSWFPFSITNVRAWAAADQGATGVVFGVRQIGFPGTFTGFAPGTGTTIYSGALALPIAAGGFSAAMKISLPSTAGPRVRPVYRCATGTAVAPQQANQWAWSTGTAGATFYAAGNCSTLIGAGGPYPFMQAIDATANGANVPVELMTFQID